MNKFDYRMKRDYFVDRVFYAFADSLDTCIRIVSVATAAAIGLAWGIVLVKEVVSFASH